MLNAEAPHEKKHEYDTLSLDRTLKKLRSKLLTEGTIEDVHIKSHFLPKRKMQKAKRARKTGPKFFNKGNHKWHLSQ